MQATRRQKLKNIRKKSYWLPRYGHVCTIRYRIGLLYHISRGILGIPRKSLSPADHPFSLARHVITTCHIHVIDELYWVFWIMLTELAEPALVVGLLAFTVRVAPHGHTLASVHTAGPVEGAPIAKVTRAQCHPDPQLRVNHIHWVDVSVLQVHVPHAANVAVCHTNPD